MARIARALPLLLLAVALATIGERRGCNAASVEIDANGGQQQQQEQQQQQRRPGQIHATFVNALPDQPVDLYWAGNKGRDNDGSLQLYYGPVNPNGGERPIDGFEGQSFVLTEAGRPGSRLGEYRLGSGEGSAAGGGGGGQETYVLTEGAADKFRRSFPPPSSDDSARKREELAKECLSMNDDDEDTTFSDRCRKCARWKGCGFSPVRDRLREVDGIGEGGCRASHAVATINGVKYCDEIDALEEASELSVEAWLEKAREIAASGGAWKLRRDKGRAPRLAYKCLERAVERSEDMLTKARRDEKDEGSIEAAEALRRRARSALSEMSAKLEAVFDDADARELLASSRHPKLAEIHPDLPIVPRCTAEEAREYVLRGEPVVVTDAFVVQHDPVAHEWTLDLLDREMFGAAANNAPVSGRDALKFNVAADIDTRCCQYFEPQKKAKQSNYPYPFAPRTHLYRHTFEGFVETVRRGAAHDDDDDDSATPRLLHYLHEIVMNKDGKAAVAGRKAPRRLANDLEATTSRLRPLLASKQPFFGDFSYGKIWLGQRGVVMPMHHDATDNLYVMAWGRKRAIIGEPGQLDAMYRYPNGHPLAGSSQVNFTEPDLERHPRFKDARLREVVVGPGDVLYLPAWWWHQFEQPFEDTAALNLWSKDRDQAPDSHVRDMNVREHNLSDQLEEAVVRLGGENAGVLFDALANGRASPHYASVDGVELKRAWDAMLKAAHLWQRGTSQLPGGHAKLKISAAALVKEHLDSTHRDVMRDAGWSDWHPGTAWDFNQTTVLPSELRERCKEASESSPFMSICR